MVVISLHSQDASNTSVEFLHNSYGYVDTTTTSSPSDYKYHIRSHSWPIPLNPVDKLRYVATCASSVEREKMIKKIIEKIRSNVVAGSSLFDIYIYYMLMFCSKPCTYLKLNCPINEVLEVEAIVNLLIKIQI